MGLIEIAAIRAGIDRKKHYRWLANPNYPDYATAYAEAQRMSDAKLEAEIRRRGEEGYGVPLAPGQEGRGGNDLFG